jgi:hypothetical protein
MWEGNTFRMAILLSTLTYRCPFEGEVFDGLGRGFGQGLHFKKIFFAMRKTFAVSNIKSIACRAQRFFLQNY